MYKIDDEKALLIRRNFNNKKGNNKLNKKWNDFINDNFCENFCAKSRFFDLYKSLFTKYWKEKKRKWK